MLTVTLPNGRTYNYAERNAHRAYDLAARTGGTVSGGARCDCGRSACGGCDDSYDARRDANLERYGIGWTRDYV